MRRLITTVIAFAAAILVSMSTASAAPMAVLHATMDNVDVGAGLGTDTTASGAFAVRDTAGTAQDGIAQDFLNTGATASAHVTSGAAGFIGEALSFPASTASNRAVTYGNVFDIGTGDYAVSIWFNALDVSGVESVAAKGNQSSSGEGWHIFTENSAIIARMGLTGAGPLDRASMSDTFTAGTWNNVVMVIDNNAGRLTAYLNGSLMSTLGGGGPSDNLFTASSDITTGDPLTNAIRADGGIEFQGRLDDFVIFSDTLTLAQARSLYTLAAEAALNYDAAGAQTLWGLFEQGTGSQADVDGLMWYGGAANLVGNPGDVIDLGGGNYSLILDANGNGVTTLVVPEPASAALLLIAATMLGRRRRSRRGAGRANNGVSRAVRPS